MVSQCPILAWEQFSYDQTISCCNVGNHKYDLAKSAVCLLFTQTKKTIYEPSVAFISTKRRVLLFITHDATRKKPRGIHRFITATLIVSCLFFFSVMNTLSKGWHLRLSMLEINDRSAVITFKHLLLLSMSYEYFTTIPQQYTDPLEPVYTREQWGEIRKKYNLGKLHYLQVNDRVLRYLHIRLWLFFNLLDPTQLDYFNNRMVFDIENINI